ncbi:site-specific integrase [Carnobacterium jeotgali]
MAKIEQYTKKDGSTAWLFQAYLGVDPATGKEKRTTRRGFKSKKEASTVLSRLKHEINQKGFLKQEVYTFREVYEIWLPQYKQTVKESSYWKTTRLFEHHILPLFSDLRINKIDVPYCQKAVDKWFNDGLKGYKLIFRYTAKVFKLAYNMDIIASDPTTKVTYPIKRETAVVNKLPNFYDKQELELFFDCLVKEDNDKFTALFRTLAFSGARIGELLALEWHDIDFKGNTLSINKTITRGENNRLMVDVPKTHSSIRLISMDNKTMSLLKAWKSTQARNYLMLGYNTSSKEQLVFSNAKNQYINTGKVYKVYIKVVNKYELKKITIHGFRHTHCSLLFEAGASVKEVQDRLGHSDIQTTMNIYAHVSKKAKDSTAERFANYLNF